jgi:hypothetical protein
MNLDDIIFLSSFKPGDISSFFVFRGSRPGFTPAFQEELTWLFKAKGVPP